MPRSIQNSVILFKPETTSGTDAAPTAAADAVLFNVSDLQPDINQLTADRAVGRGFFAGADTIAYDRRGSIKFSVELAGAGAAGVAPAWGDLLICCAMSETVTAGSRVEYLPASTNLKTATIWAYIDGVLTKFAYCAGTVVFDFTVGQIPKATFTFTGLVSTDPATAATPTATLTSWKRPKVFSKGVGFMTHGGSYSAGVISGGTGVSIQSASIDMANDVKDRALSSGADVAVYGRNPSASIVYDLSAADEVQAWTDMAAGTSTALAITHQSSAAAGDKIQLFMPVGIRSAIANQLDGNVIYKKCDWRIQPSAGNDELRIVLS